MEFHLTLDLLYTRVQACVSVTERVRYDKIVETARIHFSTRNLQIDVRWFYVLQKFLHTYVAYTSFFMKVLKYQKIPALDTRKRWRWKFLVHLLRQTFTKLVRCLTKEAGNIFDERRPFIVLKLASCRSTSLSRPESLKYARSRRLTDTCHGAAPSFIHPVFPSRSIFHRPVIDIAMLF